MLRLFVDTGRGNSARFKDVLQGFFRHLLVIKVPAEYLGICESSGRNSVFLQVLKMT